MGIDVGPAPPRDNKGKAKRYARQAKVSDEYSAFRNKLRIELETKKWKIKALEREGRVFGVTRQRQQAKDLGLQEGSERVLIAGDEAWNRGYLKRVVEYEFYSIVWMSGLNLNAFEASQRIALENAETASRGEAIHLRMTTGETTSRNLLALHEFHLRANLYHAFPQNLLHSACITLQRVFRQQLARRDYAALQQARSEADLFDLEQQTRTRVTSCGIAELTFYYHLLEECLARCGIVSEEATILAAYSAAKQDGIMRQFEAFETAERAFVVQAEHDACRQLLETIERGGRGSVWIAFYFSLRDITQMHVYAKWCTARMGTTHSTAIRIQRWYKDIRRGQQGYTHSLQRIRNDLRLLQPLERRQTPVEPSALFKHVHKSAEPGDKPDTNTLSESRAIQSEITTEEQHLVMVQARCLQVFQQQEKVSRADIAEDEIFMHKELLRSVAFVNYEVLYFERKVLEAGWEASRLHVEDELQDFYASISHYAHSLLFSVAEYLARNLIIVKWNTRHSALVEEASTTGTHILQHVATLIITRAFRRHVAKRSLTSRAREKEVYLQQKLLEEDLLNTQADQQALLAGYEHEGRLRLSMEHEDGLQHMSHFSTWEIEKIFMKWAEERKVLADSIAREEATVREHVADAEVVALAHTFTVMQHEDRKMYIRKEAIARGIVAVEEDSEWSSVVDMPYRLESPEAIRSSEKLQKWWKDVRKDLIGRHATLVYLKKYAKQHRREVYEESRQRTKEKNFELKKKIENEMQHLFNPAEALVKAEDLARQHVEDDSAWCFRRSVVHLHTILDTNLRPVYMGIVAEHNRTRADLVKEELLQHDATLIEAGQHSEQVVRMVSAMCVQRAWRGSCARGVLTNLKRIYKATQGVRNAECEARMIIENIVFYFYFAAEDEMGCSGEELRERLVINNAGFVRLLTYMSVHEYKKRDFVVDEAEESWRDICRKHAEGLRSFGIAYAVARQRDEVRQDEVETRGELESDEMRERRDLYDCIIQERGVSQLSKLQAVIRGYLTRSLLMPRIRLRRMKKCVLKETQQRYAVYHEEGFVFFYISLAYCRQQAELEWWEGHRTIDDIYTSETSARFGGVISAKKELEKKQIRDLVTAEREARECVVDTACKGALQCWDCLCDELREAVDGEEAEWFSFYVYQLCLHNEKIAVELEETETREHYLNYKSHCSYVEALSGLEAGLRTTLAAKQTEAYRNIQDDIAHQKRVVRLRGQALAELTTVFDREEGSARMGIADHEHCGLGFILIDTTIDRESVHRERILCEEADIRRDPHELLAMTDKTKQLVVKEKHAAEQRGRAVLIFQKRWRGMLARCHIIAPLRRTRAAERIQFHLKGFFARTLRSRLQSKREDRLAAREREESTAYHATLIQSIWRRSQCRRLVEAIFEAEMI